MFNNPEIRIHGTGSLFPIGQEDLLFHPRMIRTAGRGPGSQENGSFPKGTGRLSEKSPAGYPLPHHRDAPPGSAGVPPACCPFGCRSVSLRCCSRPPCRREPHGPGRSRGRAPLPVDSSGGDGRSCGRICAGGTPALPGGASPYDRVTPTGQECRSILAPVVVEAGPSVLVPYLKQTWVRVTQNRFKRLTTQGLERN